MLGRKSGDAESPEQNPPDAPRPPASETDVANHDVETKTSEQLQSELGQANDRVLRLQAELENLRRRTSREINEERRYAALPLMRDLLPVVDNVARAIEAAQNTDDAASLVEGIGLVDQQLKSVLAQHHCEPIEALSQPFDPNQHEAILQQPSQEHPPGTVILVSQIGYQLYDRVIRPSQVIVSTTAVDQDSD